MSLRRRSLGVVVCLSLGFTVISFRLVQIQLLRHEEYLLKAIKNHCDRIELPARRGVIRDVNGQILAQSQVLHDIRVDGRNLLHPDEALPEMEKILQVAPGTLAAAFNPNNRYQLLAREVPEDQLGALKDLETRYLTEWKQGKAKPARFLSVEDRFVRSYPDGAHASHVIGFLDANNKGVAGVEGAMDTFLRGLPGEQLIEKDVRGREIAGYRGRDQKPIDGYNVDLTIDLGVQHILEEGLDKIVQKFHPIGAYAIAMRPKTGEILGMANRPTFDPNDRKGVPLVTFRNHCLTDQFEPGSTFKIVTLAATLNEHLSTLSTPIFCENGRFFYAGRWLHDDEPYGLLTVEQVLAHSSNIGFAKLGLELGDQRLYDYARSFGFGEPTGLLEHQGEGSGVLRPLARWSKLSATRVPMGQEVSATPMQMAVAMSVIANRGSLIVPRVVRQITDNDGHVIKYFTPHVVRQVIGEDVAKQVSKALADVVDEGTAAGRIDIPGFTAAGKTGTAQKFVDGAYSNKKFVASFIGYVPEEDPQFVLLVMVDEPRGNQYYGAQVAAPAFSEMSKQIVEVLNLTPRSLPAEPVKRASL